VALEPAVIAIRVSDEHAVIAVPATALGDKLAVTLVVLKVLILLLQ
jgi:hypothetical protein